MNRTNLIAAAVLAALSASAAAQQHVDGYVNRHGTYVAPYMRSTPDASRMNNWSAQGNTNPFTGAPGTVNPYASPIVPHAPSGYGTYPAPYPYGVRSW